MRSGRNRGEGSATHWTATRPWGRLCHWASSWAQWCDIRLGILCLLACPTSAKKIAPCKTSTCTHPNPMHAPFIFCPFEHQLTSDALGGRRSAALSYYASWPSSSCSAICGAAIPSRRFRRRMSSLLPNSARRNAAGQPGSRRWARNGTRRALPVGALSVGIGTLWLWELGLSCAARVSCSKRCWRLGRWKRAWNSQQPRRQPMLPPPPLRSQAAGCRTCASVGPFHGTPPPPSTMAAVIPLRWIRGASIGGNRI